MLNTFREKLQTHISDTGLINKIIQYFQSAETCKGEVLLREGETARQLYFVNKGCLRVFCIGNDGKESTRYFAFEGRFATAFPSSFYNSHQVPLSILLRIHHF